MTAQGDPRLNGLVRVVSSVLYLVLLALGLLVVWVGLGSAWSVVGKIVLTVGLLVADMSVALVLASVLYRVLGGAPRRLS